MQALEGGGALLDSLKVMARFLILHNHTAQEI